MTDFLVALRYVVFGGFVLAAAVALTDWAVRNRHLPPFGRVPLFIRKVSTPVLRPLQARMVKAGHNPVDAPLWLFWIVVAGGLVLIGLSQWLVDEFSAVRWAMDSGGHGILLLVVESVYSVLVFALFIRVASSWFGVSPYAKWMRPVMTLTSWIVDPIHKRLPPMGMIDLSPFVAYLLLWAAHLLIIRSL